MKTNFPQCLLIGLLLCWISSSSIGQHSRSNDAVEVYGTQTKKYFSTMHNRALQVAGRYVEASKSPNLLKQSKWKANVLSELATLSRASRGVQFIRPVPNLLKQINRDCAALGKQMEVASATYKKGVQSSDINLIHDAVMAMKETDDILVGLSSMRH